METALDMPAPSVQNIGQIIIFIGFRSGRIGAQKPSGKRQEKSSSFLAVFRVFYPTDNIGFCESFKHSEPPKLPTVAEKGKAASR